MINNKKKKSFLARAAMVLLLMIFCFHEVWAEESKIIVWLNNGSKTEVLFNDMPEFVYADGNISLKGTQTELSWPLAQLKKFTFEASESVITDVENVPMPKAQLDFAKGCAVYDLNGKLIKEHINSLNELPAGVYIVDDGSVTTKVVKK